ncbi:MAG: phosphate ABC transporter permease PstA [Proteobacteria bacterium]|jgi:phosphate transport system permease protein|nr:phosphate ABC transporter permease PstA [Pseudomonadota bacterium]
MKSQTPIFVRVSFRRKVKNFLMLFLIASLSGVALVPLFLVFYHVVKSGFPALSWNFFTSLPAPVGEPGGGMGNALVGSLIILGLASLIAIPLGIFGGIYLSEYGKGKFAASVRFVVDLLTSVPSIVTGLFIYAMVVAPMKSYSAWAGALAYAFMMLPVMMKTTEEILKLMPDHVREAGLALGLSRWKMILFIVLRGSRPAIVTAVLISIARVAGETAPLLFTAFGNRFWLDGLSEPAPNLPTQIYSYAISPFEQWHQQAWAGAFLLLLMVFVVNLFARAYVYRAGGRK